MSKKQDPLVPVIRFFQTAPVDAAHAALTMVREIVRSRQPRLASDEAKKKAPAKRKPTTAGAAATEHEPPLPLN